MLLTTKLPRGCLGILIAAALVGLPTATTAKPKVLELDLSSYLKRVAANNPQAEINEEDISIARARFHEARDQHALFMSGAYRLDADTVPTEQSVQNYNLGVEGKWLGAGTSLRLEATNLYNFVLDSNTVGSLFDPNQSGSGGAFDPVWTSGFVITLRQPLLRGGPFSRGHLGAINASKSRVKVQQATYRVQLQSILMEALSLYWQFDLQSKNLAFLREAVKDTRELLDWVSYKSRIGTEDESSIYDIEAILTGNQDELKSTEKALRRLSFQMALAMGEDFGAGDRFRVLLKSSPPSPLEPKEISYQKALQNREDLKQARAASGAAEQALRVAKWNTLPLLNLELQLDYSGRDEGNVAALGNAVSNLGEVNYLVGLRLEVPLEAKAYRTAYERADHEARKSRKQLNLLRKQVLVDLDEKREDLKYHLNRSNRYRDMVKKMGKRLAIYRSEFRIGKWDVNALKSAHDSLRDWQKRHLSSLYELELSRARLAVAEGTFLSRHGIQFKNLPKVD